ncbi:MAG: long-chain fatty acid--CoA ligase [Alphaproteobacteria bacterium]|nr:long-chain fatty acid--CoA ligase [Alphaproteobacteria bacterium]
MSDSTATSVPHPWERSYPKDVNWRARIPTGPLHSLLDDAVKAHGARIAIDFLGRRLTYAELGQLADRAAKGLQGVGVGKGTKVCLMLPNCPAYVIGYFAILKAGGVVVNVNPLNAEAEIRGQIEDSDADVLITLDLAPIFAKAQKMLGATRLKRIVVCRFAEQLPALKGTLFKLLKRKMLAAVPREERLVDWSSLLANDGRFTRHECAPAHDVALLQYTGGTTGLPKAAMLTHANVYANAHQSLLYFPQTRHGQEIMLGVLPYFHVFAMTTCMNFSLLSGATMLLLPRFEIELLLKTIEKKRPTFMPAVPTIYIALNNHKDVIAKKRDLSSLRVCISGGAAMPIEVMNTFEKLTGCTVVEGYGLSESSPVAIVNPSTGKRKPGSLGLPVSGTIVEITSIDEPSRVLPQGERGEICLRGPQVMLGYWKRSEESEKTLADGRLHTGDVGYIDDEGYVFLIDRLKDIILCGGYNVYPRHVEEAIYQHPAVAEVTVIGVPDPYRQQSPKAFVRLREGQSLSADTLIAFLKDKLSPIEMPREIEFRTELPKTLIGKLSKKELVAEEAGRKPAASTN